MRALRRAGMPPDPVPGGLRNDPTVGPAIGNSLPPNTGVWLPEHTPPGPGPYGGVHGQEGGNDGFMGADPRAPKMGTTPRFIRGQDPAAYDKSVNNHPSWWRGGLHGFNDKLMVRDRHAYWDTGNQKTGIESTPYSVPYTYSHPSEVPPTPELRLVNRSVNPQIGSSNTAAQDDLSRNYTRNPQGMYVGEQGSGWSPIYGGVPGLVVPYGTRGGVPYPIQSPVGQGEPGDGPHLVFSGPPHGLHSPTLPDYSQTLGRYMANQQMRPVRQDRPSNSPQAGQSYSQTVLAQGGQPPSRGGPPVTPRGSGAPVVGGFGTGRGWSGVAK